MLPAEHPFRDITCEPRGPFAPQIWILGSSTYGAQLAGYFGLPYCFAYFFSDGEGAEEALDAYRRTFQPSAILQKPHCAIVVWGLAAETVEEAEYHYRSRAIQWAVRGRGKFIAMPSPEDALDYPLSEPERARMEAARANALIGPAPEVAARIQALGARLGVDEMVITTGTTSHEARVESYRLFAREFGLQAASG
jgi:luciferase family oxidoreductase group 1